MSRLVLGLVIALALVGGWAGVATYQWWTADADCKASTEKARADAETKARERYTEELGVAMSIFDGSHAKTAAALTDSASNTQARAVQIVRVPVTGACVMPAGLPSLARAVKEARDAAAD